MGCIVLHLVLSVPVLLRDHILYTQHVRQVQGRIQGVGCTVLYLVLGVPLLLRDHILYTQQHGRQVQGLIQGVGCSVLHLVSVSLCYYGITYFIPNMAGKYLVSIQGVEGVLSFIWFLVSMC